MNRENTKMLLEKYPQLFRQHSLPPTETCMCWLIETGDGWYDLIDRLCAKLSHLCTLSGAIVEFTQVKEKWGQLRIYHRTEGGPGTCDAYMVDEIVCDLVGYAEYESAGICEDCGETGEIDYEARWLSCRCDKCREKK